MKLDRECEECRSSKWVLQQGIRIVCDECKLPYPDRALNLEKELEVLKKHNQSDILIESNFKWKYKDLLSKNTELQNRIRKAIEHINGRLGIVPIQIAGPDIIKILTADKTESESHPDQGYD